MSNVILVDLFDRPLGKMEKEAVHRQGLLHRAFSIFIFNSKGEMLLQQRSSTKYHSGGLWTNACCSHPLPGETTEAAANRRLCEELGFSVTLKKVFDFTYRAVFGNGLIEYEFDHVFIGTHDGAIFPNPVEAQQIVWAQTRLLEKHLELHPELFTEWFVIALPRLLEKMDDKSLRPK